ncbi:MAG: TraR/DksA family transcriptional regulator [Alkalispirochaetaceae bacterium]
MTKQFAQHIGHVLDEAEKAIIAGVVECEDEYRALTANDEAELGDRASRSKSLDELGSVIAYYERRLSRTRAAKRRLRNGTYGLCLECGKKIKQNRLKARPDALFCISCAQRRERLKRYRVVPSY